MIKFKSLLVAGLLAVTSAIPAQAAWWDAEPSVDTDVSQALEKLLAEAQRSVGMPSIVNFFEARMVKMLYEMRDNPEYRTYTYVMTINGDFIKICDSIGFGINASIQMANPDKSVSHYNRTFNRSGRTVDGLGTLPQAEPNGLFMPEGLAATYALCIDPSSTADNPVIKPVYMEPDIIVSPFPLGNG